MFKKKKNSQFVSIYVVDDTFFVRKSIYEYLYKKPQNMEINVEFDFVGEASLKREFEDQLPSIQADLFFIDMDLPDGTAWDLIEKIYNKSPQSQIIAMTDEGSIETQELRKAYEDQVVAVLEKPFQPNHLYEVFETAIQERFQLKKESVQFDVSKTERPRIYFEPDNIHQEKETPSNNTSLEFDFHTQDPEINPNPESQTDDSILIFESTNNVVVQDEMSLSHLDDVFEFESTPPVTEQFFEWSLEPDVESEPSVNELHLIFEESTNENVNTCNGSISDTKLNSLEEDQIINDKLMTFEDNFPPEEDIMRITQKPKGVPTILLMEEVYEDDEFETYQDEKKSRINLEKTLPTIKSSEEEIVKQLEDKTEKNEENKSFDLIFDQKDVIFSEKEEENNLINNKFFCLDDLEEEKAKKEEIEEFYLLKEEKVLQNEELEDRVGEKESNIFLFEIEETTSEESFLESFDSLNEGEAPILEFALNEEESSTSLKEEFIPLEWNLETDESCLKFENDSNNQTLPFDQKSQFEYFEKPTLYTETSQLQTEEFFYLENSTMESSTTQMKNLGSDIQDAESMMQEEVKNFPTFSKVVEPQASSNEFVISPPRSKGPGVPTTPKEFGRFGIRK